MCRRASLFCANARNADGQRHISGSVSVPVRVRGPLGHMVGGNSKPRYLGQASATAPYQPLSRCVPREPLCSHLRGKSRGFEADGSDEGVEIVDDALIKAIELRSPLGLESGICFDGAEKACREWRVDAFEELQEDEAD
jgi:hypothetical protein